MVRVLMICLGVAAAAGLVGFGGLHIDGQSYAQAIFYILVAVVAGALLRSAWDRSS